MYIPNSFREERIEKLHELIQAQPLGILVTHGASGLQASPFVFLLYPNEGEYGVLRAHLAKANPHWQELENASECLVIFHGENGYVSPSWYPSKEETHRVVPTWNYIVAEVRGKPSITHDAAWLRRQLDDLTHAHENIRPQPWNLDEAPSDYVKTQMAAIVGLEIPIQKIEGKWKLSQNKAAADREGVRNGLSNENDPHGKVDLAKKML